MVIGLVLAGQAPEPALAKDFVTLLGHRVEIVQAGALDGLPREQIAMNHAPASSERTFFTAIGGNDVMVDSSFVHQRLQSAVRMVESRVNLVVILCTGDYDDIKSATTVVLPSHLILSYMKGVRLPGKWAIVMPTQVSLMRMVNKLESADVAAQGACISPCIPLEEFRSRIADMATKGTSAVLLNCFGYSEEQRLATKQVLHVPVVRPGVITAQAVARLVE